MTEADVIDIFADVAPVTVRRMFGGLGVYRDGLIFALVVGGELYLKIDEETRPEFEAVGSEPFVYDGGKKAVTMPYRRMPAECYDDPEVLERFAGLAFDAAARAGPPRKRARKIER